MLFDDILQFVFEDVIARGQPRPVPFRSLGLMLSYNIESEVVEFIQVRIPEWVQLALLEKRGHGEVDLVVEDGTGIGTQLIHGTIELNKKIIKNKGYSC